MKQRSKPLSTDFLEKELLERIGTDRAIFEFFQDSSRSGILYSDLEESGSEWVSDQFWIALGLDPSANNLFADTWRNYLLPEDHGKALAFFQRHDEDPQNCSSQTLRFRHGRGSIVTMQSRTFIVRNNDGKPIRKLSVFTDISKFNQIKDSFRRANEEIRDIAYAASHDLKAPLKSISGQLQLLESLCMDALPPLTKTLMENIQTSLDRMSYTIDGLLDYSQTATHEVSKRQFFLRDLVTDILEDHHGDLKSIPALVTSDCDCSIYSSSDLTRQILNSFVDNAIKYRRRDVGLTLKILGKVRETGWLISVEDNGIGIEERYQDRVFELLQRLHTQEEISGAGLGLCIARKSAEHLGGKIWFHSDPGIGSTFYVFLPKERAYVG